VWSFGDGSLLSTQAHPTHAYTQSGKYLITVLAGNGVFTDTLTRYLHVSDLESGLQGHWELDESEGVRYDYTANGNDLTAVQGTTVVTGQVNLGAKLQDDYQQYLMIADEDQTGLNIAGDLTIAGWINLASKNKYMVLAGKYEWGVQNRAYRLSLIDDNRLQVTISPDGRQLASYMLDGQTALRTDYWYHVAAVFDSQAQTMRLYLDGMLEAERTVNYSTIYTSTAPFMLGANVQNGNVVQYFDGYLDDWWVYGMALSQFEIESLRRRGI